MAIHAGHRQIFRPETKPLQGRAPRCAGVHPCGTRLPAKTLHPIWRLAPGPGRLQLGRRQRGPGAGSQQGARLAPDLQRPAHARRNALLRAQTASGQKHRGPARSLQDRVAADPEPPLLQERDHRTGHRRGHSRQTGQREPGRLQGSEPGHESPRDFGGRHAADLAALGQRHGVSNQPASAFRTPPVQLDGLASTSHHAGRRSGQASGHVGRATAQCQRHSGSHAGQGWVHFAGAAPRQAGQRCDRAPGRQRPTAAGPRVGVAQDHGQGPPRRYAHASGITARRERHQRGRLEPAQTECHADQRTNFEHLCAGQGLPKVSASAQQSTRQNRCAF